MKIYDEQLMKFTITNDKLKMEISLKDLVWLFHNSPNNTYDGESLGCKVKCGKRQEFAEFIAENLMMDESTNGSGDVLWVVQFEEVFERIFEGAEDDFCKYSNDDED